MDRNKFIKILIKKKYLFTDTGKNIIIHGVDPSKRLDSMQTYDEINFGVLKSIPEGVIFDKNIEIIRMEEMSPFDVPENTIFLNRNVSILIGIPEKNTTHKKSRWTNNIDAVKVDGISPIRILSLLLKLNL
jgi:hypothetical protein